MNFKIAAGPPKTGKFAGFGFGGKATAPKPGSPASASKVGGQRPKAAAAASLFQAAMAEEERVPSTGSSAGPSWGKASHEALQAQRHAEQLIAEDPTVFQYDEILDDVQRERGEEGGQQLIRTDVMTQKKRVGLTVPQGAQTVASGIKRDAKYIDRVIVATDRRRVEQQMVEDRLLKKEKNARKDAEVFVTEAFKEELKKRQRFVDELEAQEARDNALSAENMQDGLGFANMYRNLLNGGLASSRGAETQKELLSAHTELEDASQSAAKKEEGVKTEVKDEEEAATLGVKAEKEEKKEPGDDAAGKATPGVVDALDAQGPLTAGAAKQVNAAEEKAQRQDKAMSAKERFLARKAAAAAQSGGSP